MSSWIQQNTALRKQRILVFPFLFSSPFFDLLLSTALLIKCSRNSLFCIFAVVQSPLKQM